MIESGKLVICNSMPDGRQLEGKYAIDNKYWLLSQMQVLSQGVLLASCVNSDSSPGWA